MAPARSRLTATSLLLAALAGACEAERVPVETAPPGGPDLSIALVYLVQATQTPGFDVPLVAGRDAVLRVWVTATGPATAPPLVRARIYEGATVVDDLAVEPPGPTVPAGIDEGRLSSSWNVRVPGALLAPGRALLVDVDSSQAIVETDEGNNTWPASGVPHPLDVVALPPLRLRVLAVTTGDGLTSAASAASLPYFTSKLQRAWPVGELEASFGGTFGSSVTPGRDGAGWSTLLSEIAAKRAADGFGGHLYGAIRTSYTSGVAGMGYVPGYAAIGWDRMIAGNPAASSSSEVLAHELGHNFGLAHAPGCDAGNPDPAYPYGGAVTGAYGLDLATGAVMPPTLHDLMAYCSDTWVSDYNTRKVVEALDARALVAEEPAPAALGEPGSLLVWGHAEAGARVLEPAFHLPAAARPPPPGPERLTGLDAAGDALFTVPFSLADATCGGPPAAGFAFTVPLSAAGAARLAALRWESPAADAVVRTSAAASALRAAPPEVEGSGGAAVRVRWQEAEPDEVALVLDGVTGEVLGFGRAGTVRVVPASDLLEVRLPAGGPARRWVLRAR